MNLSSAFSLRSSVAIFFVLSLAMPMSASRICRVPLLSLAPWFKGPTSPSLNGEADAIRAIRTCSLPDVVATASCGSAQPLLGPTGTPIHQANRIHRLNVVAGRARVHTLCAFCLFNAAEKNQKQRLNEPDAIVSPLHVNQAGRTFD